MNTWTCKVLVAGLACLALSGCEGGLNLPGLNAAQDNAPVLRMAELGGGAVTVVPPQGYCIDPASLKQRFALMARCDTLGEASGLGAPLALITATAVPAQDDAVLTAADIGAGAEAVLDSQDRAALTFVQVQGQAPRPGLSDVYWRTAGRIGDQIVGLSIYEPVDGLALGALAPQLLEQTMQRTQDQTVAKVVASAGNSATTRNKATSPRRLSGLFE